jgi:hypothetical protein
MYNLLLTKGWEMEAIRNVYTQLIGNLEGRYHLGHIDVPEKIQ